MEHGKFQKRRWQEHRMALHSLYNIPGEQKAPRRMKIRAYLTVLSGRARGCSRQNTSIIYRDSQVQLNSLRKQHPNSTSSRYWMKALLGLALVSFSLSRHHMQTTTTPLMVPVFILSHPHLSSLHHSSSTPISYLLTDSWDKCCPIYYGISQGSWLSKWNGMELFLC